MSNSDVVTRFLRSWETGDLADTMSFFADNAVYHNLPMPKLVGHAQIAGFIGEFFSRVRQDSVSFKVLHQAENAAGCVFNERLDEFVLRDGRRISMPVVGVFEFDNGKIKAWREHFDMKEYEAQLTKNQ